MTDPNLYESIVTSPCFHDDSTFQQAIVLFRNYTLIRQLFARLAVPRLPIQIAEAFDPALAAACTSVLVLLVDQGLDRLLGTLPRDHLTSILRTVILSLLEGQRRAYYSPDDPVEGTVQEEEEDCGPPPPCVEPHSPCPTRASSPTDSVSSTNTAVNPSPNWPAVQTHFPLADQTPFPLGNAIEGMQLQLREVGLELTKEELRQWALDALLCLEDWKWLWEPVQASTPLTFPTPPPPHLPWYDVFNAGPPIMSTLNALNTSAPSVEWLPQDIPNVLATCAPVPFVENLVMWAPVVQLQPQLTHPLPEWLTNEVFESESRIYNGGNVTVEDPPISFSPFSSANCTMLSHFSFNDFVTVAFPDLARDLDIQI